MMSYDHFNHSFFFFKQNTAYERLISDWSSDVCSSDLLPIAEQQILELSRCALLLFPRHFDFAEDRRVLHAGAQIHADETHRSGNEKRDAPAPVIHRGLPKTQGESQHQQRAEGDRKSTRLNSSH